MKRWIGSWLKVANLAVPCIRSIGTASPIEVHKPDVIVVGTHGRSGFQRLTLGSVTERLLNVLPCDYAGRAASNLSTGPFQGSFGKAVSTMPQLTPARPNQPL
jgi:hypothetical protein